MTRAVAETQGYSIFCDDIREEINAKTTLVGMYSGEMLVAAAGPVLVPQLCYMGKVFFNPAAAPSTISIVLRRYQSDGEMLEIGRMDLPPIAEIPVPPKPMSYGPGESMVQINAALRISPLAVEADFTLRSILIVDGIERPIGSMTVKLVDSLP
ncbi:hypothetical protein [Sphingobium naphthae]|uniref:Uncharacterized protein n=1 Tax=Sphingobium naphthae TaxID=1886786 RepID=A0ABU3ZTS3_9SPHN|nr:hypothetical protein [Sphingobium naphthae]MDV5822921.1 hypothetical protein [Sphingobium naphthae]